MRILKNSLIAALCVFATMFALVGCGTGNQTDTAKLTSLKVSDMKTDFTLGEEFSLGDAVVEGIYSDDTTKVIESGYEVDSSAYNSEEAGTYEIVITYKSKKVTYEVSVVGVKYSSISAEGAKTEFEWYESFSFNGTVWGWLSLDECEVLEDYDIDFSAFMVTQPGEYEIIISVGGLEYTYTVTIKAVPLSQIILSDMKTEFEWGEEFVFDGIVEEKYANGNLVAIDETMYEVDASEYNPESAGTYTITVTHKQNATIKKSYEVTVGPADVVAMRIDSYKNEYSVFEDFDISDVVGYFELPDGTEEPITEENATVDVGDYKELTLGAFAITISHVKKSEISETINIRVVKPEKVRILFIGNSFSDDTSEYVPDILKDLGYNDFEVGNMFIGGCTLDMHYNNAVNNVAAYDFRYYAKNSKTWNRFYGNQKQTIEYAVKLTDWDIISIQQASGSSGVKETYSNIDKLANKVLGYSTNSKVKIVFNMTWAYQSDSTHAEFPKYNNNQMTMYNAIISAVQTKVKYTVVPNGTAIQNARTSFLGDTLTHDGYHLAMPLGRYLAAVTFVSKVLDDDLSSLTFIPSGVTAKQRNVVVESALNAIKNPFEVTQSSYKS